MNKALIEEAATELFGADQAARLMKHIEGKRDVVEKIIIKRVAAASNKTSVAKKIKQEVNRAKSRSLIIVGQTSLTLSWNPSIP